jgi:hypothetical protein
MVKKAIPILVLLAMTMIPAPSANAKPDQSRYDWVQCPEDNGRAELIYKMDGKKIIKLAIRSCRYYPWSIAWWQVAGGKKVAVWVEPDGSTDLWKDELNPLPTKTTDGKVHLVSSDGYDRDDMENDDRPFHYDATAAGNWVGCWEGALQGCTGRSMSVTRYGITVTWKRDKDRLVKLAVQNPTDDDGVVEWSANGGKTYDLVVPPRTSIDLWKDELKPFGSAPTKLDDDPEPIGTLGDTRWDCKVWEVQPDGSIRLTHASPSSAPGCQNRNTW